MPFVERDIEWIRVVQVSRSVVGVDELQAVRHQLVPETLSLHRYVDTDPREIPVGLSGMPDVHLTQYLKKISKLLRRDSRFQVMRDRVVVKPGRWGEPDSGGPEVAEYPGAAFAEGLSSEGVNEVAIVSEVPRGFRIEPTDDRICREGHHYCVDGTPSISLCDLHERLSLGYVADHGTPSRDSPSVGAAEGSVSPRPTLLAPCCSRRDVAVGPNWNVLAYDGRTRPRHHVRQRVVAVHDRRPQRPGGGRFPPMPP